MLGTELWNTLSPRDSEKITSDVQSLPDAEVMLKAQKALTHSLWLTKTLRLFLQKNSRSMPETVSPVSYNKPKRLFKTPEWEDTGLEEREEDGTEL